MSDCSKGAWKLPKEFPASVIRVGERFRLRVGGRVILMDQRAAECVLADLIVLLKEGEYDDRR